MSGGHYNYVGFKIKEIQIENVNSDPRRAAFQKLLGLVADAMHDIEWVDSGDYGSGDEHKSIDACFAFLNNDANLVTKAHAYDHLEKLLKDFFTKNHKAKE